MYSSSLRIILAALVASLYLVSASPVNRQLAKRSKTYKGEGTYFEPGMGSCGEESSSKDMMVAVNHKQMENGANPNNNSNCGRRIKVKGPNGSVTVKALDTCPSCDTGDLGKLFYN
jgi:expansin (peptidoglycan-binding protein)